MKKIKSISLYDAFIGYLTKNGQKIKSRKILNLALVAVSLKFNLSIKAVLTKILKRVGCLIEVKSVLIKNNVTLVPCIASKNRRYYLTVKKIMDSVKSDKTKRSTTEKLIDEFTGILLLTKTNKSLLKTKTEIKDAITNRSNTHFRW